MRTTRLLTALFVCGLSAALAVPAVAAPAAYHDRSSMRGTMATASWFSEDEVPVGSPRAIAVVGADARLVNHVNGSAPVTEEQPTLVAMALMMPGENPGDDPMPAEVWGLATDEAFVVARDLSSASVSFTTLAEIYTWDPVTGDDVSTGETIRLTVTAEWTATGPVVRQHLNRREAGDLGWIMEHIGVMARPATATATITGPDGVIFDGDMYEAEIDAGTQWFMSHTSAHS